MLGAVLDTGHGRTSAGARYLHTHLAGSGCNGLGVGTWLGYGPELSVTTNGALIALAVARAGFMGDTGGLVLELGAGAGADKSATRALGKVGAFYSMYYVDFGASVEFPIAQETTAWLGGAQFALRIHVPVKTYAKQEIEEGPRANAMGDK